MASGQLKVLRSPEKQPVFAAGFEWMRDERILEFGIRPIDFKGDVLGAMVGFAREHMPESFTAWGRIFADHVGAAIAHARAFDEIQRLKAQLEQLRTAAGAFSKAPKKERAAVEATKTFAEGVRSWWTKSHQRNFANESRIARSCSRVVSSAPAAQSSNSAKISLFREAISTMRLLLIRRRNSTSSKSSR